MTERLADIGARITGIQQLGAVVNAMRGIAAARARQARDQLVAVDRYAATIAAAIGRAFALVPPARSAAAPRPARSALVLFCAEQGFAGAFSERVLDSTGPDLGSFELFLVGTRGQAALAERGISAGWTCPMPSHSSGVPKLAERIVQALYAPIAAGSIDRLEVIYSRWAPDHLAHIERAALFPIERADFLATVDANAPLLYLSPAALLADLTGDYLHAQLCHAALHAFAAENEARMETMAAARTQIERQLAKLQARQRSVRQEEITAEIIELAAGEAASRA